MTYYTYMDGPLARYSDEGEGYHRYWTLRCNGSEVLESEFNEFTCHNQSEGRYERIPAAELREIAHADGWTTGTYDGRIVDLCPECRRKAEQLLALAMEPNS